MFKKQIAVAILGMVYAAFSSSDTSLIKFYESADQYYLVPPSRIMLFDYDKSDKEAEISIDGHGSTLFKVSIDDISEQDFLDLTNKIYSKSRKELLSVKIDSTN